MNKIWILCDSVSVVLCTGIHPNKIKPYLNKMSTPDQVCHCELKTLLIKTMGHVAEKGT
jgi:hypothetical protein